MVVLTAAMLPLRTHLSSATTALVLVVPVVVGVASGGFLAGVLSVVGGFVIYDFFFIPPYLTLNVGAPQNWAALGVYVAVMLPVAHVVARMNTARAQARRRGLQIRRLFELSTLLVEDRPLPDLLNLIVTTLVDVLDARHVALLLPDPADGERTRIAAAAGEQLSVAEQQRLLPQPGQVTSLDPFTAFAANGQYGTTDQRQHGDEPLQMALIAAGRPVGLLAITGTTVTDDQREPLLLFANQIALAVERAQLREQALRARLTEEVERLARTLVAAVAHDLRSPLASIKASTSVLADAQLDHTVTEASRRELAGLVDAQVDRLAGLVTSLLDMSRIQAGALHPRTSVTSVGELIGAVLRELPGPPTREIVTDIADNLPLLDIDTVLIARALTNLIDNAVRFAPKDTPITVRAYQSEPAAVTISVADHGPGIAPDQRADIFGLFVRREADAGTGLGLTIAKMFVEAHRQHIWVEQTPGGGACFCFTVPAAAGLAGLAGLTGRTGPSGPAGPGLAGPAGPGLTEENAAWPRSSSSTTTLPCSPRAGSD